MRTLYTIQKSIFNEFEVMYNKKPVKIYQIESEAISRQDQLNVDLVIEVATEFICWHGGKINYLFTKNELKHALIAKTELQAFVTGSNNLKGRGKASGVFVWHLLQEYVLFSIAHLNHSKQPYANLYGELVALVNSYDKMYAPPLFEEEYKGTPQMMEWLGR